MLSVFFGEFGRSEFDRVPIQKNIRVITDCPPERVSTSYFVNASRQDGYIAIIFYGIAKTNKEFPFSECKRLSIITQELKWGELSIGKHFDFDRAASTPRRENESIEWKEAGSGIIDIDVTSIESEESAFSLQFPLDDLLQRNGRDTWALDLEIVSVYRNSGIIPNGTLSTRLEVLTDSDLSLERVEPALARTRPNIHAETSYDITLTNREVIGPDDSFLRYTEFENQLNTVNDVRLQLTLRDQSYSQRRDVAILVLSTLFGISVTVLFEALLVLSVKKSLLLYGERGSTRSRSSDHSGITNRPSTKLKAFLAPLVYWLRQLINKFVKYWQTDDKFKKREETTKTMEGEINSTDENNKK